MEDGRSGQQSTRDGVVAPCLVPLLSTSAMHIRDQPPCSSLLRFEGVERRTGLDGVAGDLEEGSSGQQGVRDEADAPYLMLLLSASVLCLCDEPPGSSLLRFGHAERDWEEDGVRRGSGREEEGRNGQQSTSDDADVLSLVHLLFASALRVRNEPPGSSLLSFEAAGTVGEANGGRGECKGSGGG